MRIAPVDLYDVAAQQAWLEDQAAKGRFLSGYGRSGAWAAFRKGEPKAVRYRFEPLAQKDEWVSLDRRDAYGAQGWDHVTTVGNAFHVWRCDDPAAPELDTDPEVRAMAYGYQRKRMRWSDLYAAAVTLLTLTLWAWVELRQGMSPNSWQPLWRAIVIGVAYILTITELLRERITFHRFVRGVKSGVPQPQRRPYRLARAMMAVLLALAVGLAAVWLADLLEPRTRPYLPVEAFEETVPCVDLGPGEHMALPWENWRTPEQWWINQDPDAGGWVQSRYYRFWTEGQAERFVRQEKAWREDYQCMEAAGFDEVWWSARAAEDDVDALLLRAGTQVMHLFYSSSLDLTPCLDDYAALLAGRS